MAPDHINGLYETIGGLLIWRNVWRLYKDKMVRGVSLLSVSFFASWGAWNLYYYPHLHQWCSFVGGIFIAVANIFWLVQMGYYIHEEKRQ